MVSLWVVVIVVMVVLFYLNTENASGEKSTEEDSTSPSKPLPVACSDPHQSAKSKKNDSDGDDGAGEWGH